MYKRLADDGPRFCPSKTWQRKKAKERGKKVQNKIMRDNGIMVFLWRLFCTWKPPKKKFK
jgi:hypothetical protein